MAPQLPSRQREEQMRPDDVQAAHTELINTVVDDETTPEEVSPFQALFTPRNRGRMLNVFLTAVEPQTATQVCKQAGIARSTFDDHVSVLEAAGVVQKGGEMAGAATYRTNRSHPVVQLLTMAKTVQSKGVTPMLLDEEFIGRPEAEYEPGDHPADPRDD